MSLYTVELRQPPNRLTRFTPPQYGGKNGTHKTEGILLHSPLRIDEPSHRV